MGAEEQIIQEFRAGSPSIMAEGIALQRMAETMLPEDVRIFSDPYAVHFIDPGKMAWAMEHPKEVQEITETIERTMPGWNNAIRGRIRYFDDMVRSAPDNGFTQIVILGAGYDTRAWRIGKLKDRIRIFEIDRPETIARKIGVVQQVLKKLPEHVAFIPFDMAAGGWWEQLIQAGWENRERTLFVIEGLVMYLPYPAVESLFTGIARHAVAGSAVLFDFVPRSLADGSSDEEGGQNIRNWTIRVGEPILSGFAEPEAALLLEGLGYAEIVMTGSRSFAERYYTGKNAGRKVSGLMSLAYAVVGDRAQPKEKRGAS